MGKETVDFLRKTSEARKCKTSRATFEVLSANKPLYQETEAKKYVG